MEFVKNENGEMNLGIITDKPYDVSETFIKAHIDNLPFKICHYYGVELPLTREGSPLHSKQNTITRLLHKVFRKDLQLRKTMQLFQDDKVSVVLAEYGPVGVLVTKVCKKLNIPLIVHFHGYDATRKSVISRYKKPYVEMFHYAKWIISVSPVMTTKLIELGCPKEKIIYNVYGPNDKFLAIVPKFIKQQFIGVGRFVEKKAPQLLIKAFYLVLRKFPEVKLILAGDGILLNDCFKLVKSLGIQNSVELPGKITPDKFMEYLSESLAFVQHSITADDGDMEGTPVAILEASAAGLPVISTRHAGIPDIIIDGETGYLVEEKDIIGMAEKMSLFVTDLNMAKDFGTKGKQYIQSNFSFEKHIKGLASIIKSVFP